MPSSLVYSLVPRQSAWWLVEAGDFLRSVDGAFGGSVSVRNGVAVHRLVHAFGYRVLGFSCGGISLLKWSGFLGVIVFHGLGWDISW